MLRKKKGSIEWLEFELFAPHPQIFAAVFLRHGGVSQNHYHSLNAGSGGQDPKENILANRKLIGDVLGLNEFEICGQPHQDKVAILPTDDEEMLEESDGMMTTRVNKALLIKHADCQAAIFFDPKLRALACVHAGWRGQTKNIYHKTVEQMKSEFGCSPADILVAVSPSLGPNHAEFIRYQTEWPKEVLEISGAPKLFRFMGHRQAPARPSRDSPNHMQYAEICTYSTPSRLLLLSKGKAHRRACHQSLPNSVSFHSNFAE